MPIAQVESPDQSFLTANFRFGVWVTGNPVVTDSAPTNLGSVPANRIVKAVRKGNGLSIAGSGRLQLVVVGGTSASIVPWFYDNTLGAWVAFNAALVIAGGNSSFVNCSFMGAQLYAQVTAVNNTGTNVTAVGYDFF